MVIVITHSSDIALETCRLKAMGIRLELVSDFESFDSSKYELFGENL